MISCFQLVANGGLPPSRENSLIRGPGETIVSTGSGESILLEMRIVYGLSSCWLCSDIHAGRGSSLNQMRVARPAVC